MQQAFLKRVLVIISVIAILAQSLSPYAAFSQKAYAQEVTPTIEQPTPTPTDTPAPTVDQTTPMDTVTPTPTDTPTETITPTPTEEPTTVTPTPVDNNSPPTDNNSGNQDGSNSSNDNPTTPTVTPEVSASPTPTPTETTTGNEQLSMTILKDVSAPTINLDMVVSEGSASLTTDKPDYAPTDTALITGSNLLPNTTYALTISSTDNPPTSTTVNVTSNDKGVFAYAYQLDGNYRPNYKAELKDETGTVVASITFTDTNTVNTILVSNLQPSYTATNGGGVWAAYYAPDSDTSSGVSPGSTEIYDGAQAGIIKAGITPESNGHYRDEGLLAFKVPSVSLSSFASQTLTYVVENQTGINPVWARIRLTDDNQTEYQFVPSPYPTGWHTIDAASGNWQLMDDNGNATGNPMTLSQVAAANPGLAVDRVYLTLGQGDSYNVSPGIGTVAWVDKVTIGGTIYDFVLAPASNPTTNPATSISLNDATLNGTNGPYDATGHSFWVSLAPFSTTSPTIPSGVYSTPDFGAITANTAFSASLSSITTTGIPTNLPAVTPNTQYYYVAWSLVNGTWYPGNVLNFTTTALDTTAPATPSLVSPADGVYRHTSNSNKSDWTDVTDPSLPVVYYYESSLSTATNSDGSFTSTAYQSSALTVSEIMNPGEPEVTYYWHVKACDAVGNCSAWSPSWQIHIDNTNPSVPANGTPHNTTIATNNFDFNWDDSTDNSPITYKYQASQNPTNSGGVLTNGLWTSGTLPTSMIHSSGAGDGTWYWQVKAVDAAGNESAWSPIWNVTIDTVAPTTPGQIGWSTENPPVGSNYASGSDFDNYRTCGQSLNYSPMTNLWGPSTDANGVVGYDREVYSPDATTLISSSSLSTNYVNGGGATNGSTYWVSVRAYDAAGNKSAWTPKCGITYDVTAPTVASVDSDGQTYNLSTASPHTIKISFSENISNTPSVDVLSAVGTPQTVTNCGDSDLKTFCFAYTVPNPNEDTHIIHIHDAQDAAGNTMIFDGTHTFKVDTIAPVITIAPYSTAWTNGDVVVNASVNDSGTLNATSHTFTANGSFTFTATDAAGNSAVPQTVTISNIDKTAPTVGTITITPSVLSGGVLYITNLSTISSPVSDTGSGIDPASCRYNINGGITSFTTVPSAYDSVNHKCVFTGIDTSAATGIAVSVDDNAGNGFNASSSWVSVIVDTTAPTTTDNIDANWHNGNVTVTLTCTDNPGGIGCSHTYYTTDGSTPTTGSSSGNSFTLSSEGTYTVKYFSVDSAGNTESVKTAANQVKIDKTNPTVSWDTPNNGAFLKGTITLKATASDSTSGINFVRFRYKGPTDTDFTTIATDQNSPYKKSWDTTTVSDGVYTLRAHAEDNSGRTKNDDITVTVDNRAPSGGSIDYTDGDYSSLSVPLTVNDGTDTGSGINEGSRIVLRSEAVLTDGTCGTFGTFAKLSPFPGTYPDLVDTTVADEHCYIYKYLVSDNVSNQATYTSLNVAKVDIAPVISGEFATAVSTSSITVLWTTDKPATSRVVYDTVSHSLGSAPDYGYTYSTTIDSTKVTSHSVTIGGLSSGTTYYFRTISNGSPETVGGEHQVNTVSTSFTTSDGQSDGASTGNGGGGSTPALANVLGISTAFAYGGTGQGVLGAETQPEVLGTATTSASPTPTVSPTPAGQTLGSTSTNWLLSHITLFFIIFIILVAIAYFLYRKKRKK